MKRNRKTLLMETTSIDPSRSAAEITAELVKAGAVQIATDYDLGNIAGLRWTLRVGQSDVVFQMPARVEPVYELLCKRKGVVPRYSPAKQVAWPEVYRKAERVAWRQLLRWVQAQLAMIETGMVQAAEVFLPYMIHQASGHSLYAHLMESGMKMLEAPKQ